MHHQRESIDAVVKYSRLASVDPCPDIVLITICPPWQNVGRRRFPTYWIHGTKVLVRTPRGEVEQEDMDQAEMSLEEGRNAWSRNLPDEEMISVPPEERNGSAPTLNADNGTSNAGWAEKEPANKAS